MAVRSIGLMLLGMGLLAATGSGFAQAPGDAPLSYSPKLSFKIPFQIDPGSSRLREVQLWSSIDQGKTWAPAGTVAPETGYFTFTADRDGLFYFTVRTVDREGRSYPPRIDASRPGLKVIVDTHPPVVELHALAPRDGQVAVAWDIRDDNLDLSTIALDYRINSTEWRPLHIDPAASGQHAWRPDSTGALELRLRVRDRAGNAGEKHLTLGGGSEASVGVTAQPAPATPATRPGVRMINSKRLSLNYEVRDQGRSGVSTVELWYTTDSRSWQKRDDKPYTPGSPLTIDVEGEGLYGFTIIPRSGVGLSQPPPQVGDQPQVWVEVDLTPPAVHLQDVQVGQGTDSGKLTVFYTASDKHLARQPITLEYAESAAGPWKPIAREVENTGRYVWQMPQDVPYQFLLRVKAVDQAGNVGSDQTAALIKVDLAQPKGVILDVLPGK